MKASAKIKSMWKSSGQNQEVSLKVFANKILADRNDH
jgi:hypothetical protein